MNHFKLTAIPALALGFALVPAMSFAQTPPSYPSTTPFNVQIPPPPTSGMPSAQMPMALPPSASGYNPGTNPTYNSNPNLNPNLNQNQNLNQNPNLYPQNTGGQNSGRQTHSEVLSFSPKKEVPAPVLVVKTSEGEFKITFKQDIAPKNVTNFVELALGQKEFTDIRTGKKVKRPFYTGLNCHRVIKSVLIQCGCPFGNGLGGPGYRVQDERSTAMRFDRPGVVAMALARTPDKNGIGYEPNSAGSQFFITLGAQPLYNDQFTVIGQVTSGMDTLRKIAATPTGPTDRPLKRVIIFSIDPELAVNQLLTPNSETTSEDAPVTPTATPHDSMPPALPGTIDPFAAPGTTVEP